MLHETLTWPNVSHSCKKKKKKNGLFLIMNNIPCDLIMSANQMFHKSDFYTAPASFHRRWLNPYTYIVGWCLCSPSRTDSFRDHVALMHWRDAYVKINSQRPEIYKFASIFRYKHRDKHDETYYGDHSNYVCMYVCMHKGWATSGPCTAIITDLLCFPFFN
jgi:hypothetical protein